MKEGQLKSSNRSGCLMYLALIYAFPMLAALAVLPLGVVYLCFRAGEIGNGLFVLAVEAGAVYLFIKYITSNEGRNTRKFGKTFGRSETIQERDVIKPSEFLNLQVGEFAGLAVESNKPTFRTRFKQAQRPQPAELKKPDFSGSVSDYYKRVRYDINKMLEIGGTAGEYDRDTMKLNETKRNFFGVEY